MPVLVNNSKGETYCYDEKNPMIFEDQITAIHYLKDNGVTNEELIEMKFEEINVIQNN